LKVIQIFHYFIIYIGSDEFKLESEEDNSSDEDDEEFSEIDEESDNSVEGSEVESPVKVVLGLYFLVLTFIYYLFGVHKYYVLINILGYEQVCVYKKARLELRQVIEPLRQCSFPISV